MFYPREVLNNPLGMWKCRSLYELEGNPPSELGCRDPYKGESVSLHAQTWTTSDRSSSRSILARDSRGPGLAEI